MKYLIKIVLMVLFVGVTLFAKDVATVTGLNGGAFIQRDGEKIEVSLGVKLQENDTIITNEKAKVQIIFKDETIVTLGKNSNFSISEYLFDDNQKPVVKFGMLRGAMRTITGQIGKVAPDRFSVVTKTATIGIRGTNFTVLVDKDGSHNVFCTFGAIDVTINGIKHRVNQGFYLHLSANGKVSVKEFSPDELKKMQEKSFGKSDKKASNKENISVTTEGQTDETINDDSDMVIKDIASQVQDAQETNKIEEDDVESDQGGESEQKSEPIQIEEVISYAYKGYGTNSANDGSHLYFSNFNVDYYSNDDTFVLTSGSLRYDDSSDGRSYLLKSIVYNDDMQTQFSDVIYDDETKDVTNLSTNISENYFQSMENAVDSDYISWGEWGIKYDVSDGGGTPQTIEENGLWVDGDPTDTAVIDGISDEYSYTGAYKAYDFDNNGDLIDGNAALDVDFGNDKATLYIDYGGSNITFSDMPIDGNSFSGAQDDTGYGEDGSATGMFYGPNADVAGGEFIISDDIGVHAKGVYQVGDKTPSGGQ